MAEDFVLKVTTEGLLMTLVVSGPPVLISLAVGLLIALFQAITQIHEQTLTFVPKLIIVFGVLAVMGPWLGGAIAEFGRLCFEGFPTAVGR
ncbi:MAG: flagellar biosynthesis protein FliQ [Deltaproteobacteria bacterium]|nr:flagellar biosynthesis protein FliQ [Deltaproteobacteria bacterium]